MNDNELNKAQGHSFLEVVHEELRLFVNQYHLTRVGVAVSGGVDSTVLLHAIAHIPNIEIVVLHLNHQIREESERDEKFVREMCSKYGVAIHTTKVDVPLLAAEQKISLELAGRNARYQFFKTIQKQEGLEGILTAHHMDDQVETGLYRLIRGTGIYGMVGMKQSSLIHGVRVLRPLLELRKKTLIKYADEAQLEFREDSTNQDNGYDRNRIRNGILKEMENINSLAPNAINRFMETAKEYQEFVMEIMRSDFQGIVTENKCVKFSLERFLMMNKLQQSFIIREMYRQLSHGASRLQVSKNMIEIIIDFVLHGQGGGKIDLPGGDVLIKSYDFLEIHIFEQEVFPERCKITSDGKYYFGYSVMRCETVPIAQVQGYSSSEKMFFDKAKIKFPITVRSFLNGDKINIFPQGNSKKIQDVFVDQKIARSLRPFVPIVVDNDGEILSIANIKRSSHAILDQTTEDVFVCSFKKNRDKS